MATIIGTAVNSGYSQKWVYGDWTFVGWDGTYFVADLTVYTQYQHQRSAYQGLYGTEGVMPYYLSDRWADGSSSQFYSASEYVGITYLQYTGLKWGVSGVRVYIPRGTNRKACWLASMNPGFEYSFWNYEAAGTIYTPMFSWAAPTRTVTVVNNGVGTINISAGTPSYAGGAVPASFGSDALYCDTNPNPTTARSWGNISVEHNTTYYWKYIITDNHNTSNTYTGSILTLGNAPTMTGTSVSNITTNGAVIEYTVSYDTNASYSSRNIEYGTTTSYGSSTTNTTLSGLLPNTTYYYRVRVTDNFGRTSEWITGSFITHPTTVQVVNPQVTNITFSGCTLSMGSSDNSVTDMSSYAIYASDQTTLIQGHFDDTPAVYSKNITGLEPNTTYYARFALRTERSNAWSTIQWVQFTTPVLADYAKVIYEDGTIVTKKMYAIYKETIIENVQPVGSFSGSGITFSTNGDGNLEVVSTAENENWLLLNLGSNYADIIENSLSENDEFTISIEMKSPNHTSTPTIYIKNDMGYYDMNGTMSSNFSIFTYTGIWKDADNIALHLGFRYIVGTTIVGKIKIEKHIKKEITRDKLHLIE